MTSRLAVAAALLMVFVAWSDGGSSDSQRKDLGSGPVADPSPSTSPNPLQARTTAVRRIFRSVAGFAFNDVGMPRGVADAQIDAIEVALGDTGKVTDSQVMNARRPGLFPVLVTGAMIRPEPGYSGREAFQAIAQRVSQSGVAEPFGSGVVVEQEDTLIALDALRKDPRLVIVLALGQPKESTKRLVARIRDRY